MVKGKAGRRRAADESPFGFLRDDPLFWLLILAVLAITAVFYAVQWRNLALRDMIPIAATLIAIFSVTRALLFDVRMGGRPQDSPNFFLLLACVSWLGAWTLYFAIEVYTGRMMRFPSFPDALFLLANVFLLAFFLRRFFYVKGLLLRPEVAASAGLSTVLGFFLLIGPLSSLAPLPAKAVSVAYIVSDLSVLALVMAAAIGMRRGALFLPTLLVLAAFALFVLGDMFYYHNAVLDVTFSVQNLAGVLWVLSAILIAAGKYWEVRVLERAAGGKTDF